MRADTTVKVWDPLVRICHWSLVVFFAIAYVTGEGESDLHIYSGYAVLGLVVIRLLWGFIGSEHARFKDFIFNPGTVIQYLKSIVSGNPRRYLGHNPAGGYMAILLLIMLVVVTITGLKVYGIDGHGPLAYNTGFAAISVAIAGDDHKTGKREAENPEKKFWKEIHEAASNFTLTLIVLHILGVIASSFFHKENLVKAMITGEKEARSTD